MPQAVNLLLYHTKREKERRMEEKKNQISFNTINNELQRNENHYFFSVKKQMQCDCDFNVFSIVKFKIKVITQ